MHWQMVTQGAAQTPEMYVLIFDIGDEVMQGLRQFSAENAISGAQFSAIGAFSSATLAYFQWEQRRYQDLPVREQVEVLIFSGDVAMKDGRPEVHAHCVLGRRDGSTIGGHVKDAYVRPTLEVVLTETPAHLRRTVHDESGLPLIDLRPGAAS